MLIGNVRDLFHRPLAVNVSGGKIVEQQQCQKSPLKLFFCKPTPNVPGWRTS